MKTSIVSLGFIALLAGSAAAQTSSDARIGQDIRCFAVFGPASSRMMRDSNPRVRLEGSKLAQGAAYFLGRVDGLVPHDQLAQRILSELTAMRADGGRGERARCRAEFDAVDRRINAVGETLKAAAPDA
jgi:hypothetical protein